MKKYSVILFALPFLYMWCDATTAACWELTDKDGVKIQVSDIWHIKSRLTKVSTLMGKLDGEDTSILVDEINTIALEPAKQGIMSFMGDGTMKGNISFANGSTGKFEPELNLVYLKDEKKSSLPISDLRLIKRCDTETPKEPVASTQPAPAASTQSKQAISSDADSVYLSNGDSLFGKITTTDFQWRAPYASLTFKREQIQTITLKREGMENGLIELRSGDRISGVLRKTNVEMTLKYGQRVPLAVDMLESIHFFSK